MFRSNKALCALIFITIIVFWRVVIAGYVQWDDPVFILNNALLREPLGLFLPQIFSHYFFGDYLPMTLISFWAEFQVWGAQPEPQHILNLILHLLNITLLFTYLQKLPLPRGTVLFIAAIFALHPLQTEVVMWISERKSLLALFFAFLAMHAAQKETGKNGIRFGYILFFGCSLLSKSTAILLPLLLITSDLLFFKSSPRAIVKKHFLTFTLALAWGVVRILAYSQAVANSASFGWNFERIQSLPRQIFAALGFYLEKFFMPVGLSAVYPPYANFQNTFWLIFAVLFFGGFSFYGFRRKNPQVLYFLALIILFLLPVLQIIPRINFVSDRYLYFPLIGFAGLCASVAPSFLRHAKIASVVVLAFGVLTYQRTSVWTSDLNLWTDTVEKNSQSGLAQNNLGLALLNDHQVAAAIPHFELSGQLGAKEGTSQLAFGNLGLIYSSSQWPQFRNFKLAETYYLKSIEVAPQDSAEAKFNLGLLYAETQRTTDSLFILENLERELAAQADQKNLEILNMTRKVLSQLKK